MFDSKLPAILFIAVTVAASVIIGYAKGGFWVGAAAGVCAGVADLAILFGLIVLQDMPEDSKLAQ